MATHTKAELIDTKTGEIKELFCRSSDRRCDFTEIEKIPGEKFRYRFRFEDLELILERRVTTDNLLSGKIKITSSRN